MKENEAKVRDVCKKYKGAKQAIQIAERGLETIEKKIQTAENDREKRMYESALERKKSEVKTLNETIMTFSTCIDVLPAEERNVIEQLYAKGRKWEELCDQAGCKYSKTTIMAIRQRALRRMAKFI